MLAPWGELHVARYGNTRIPADNVNRWRPRKSMSEATNLIDMTGLFRILRNLFRGRRLQERHQIRDLLKRKRVQ